MSRCYLSKFNQYKLKTFEKYIEEWRARLLINPIFEINIIPKRIGSIQAQVNFEEAQYYKFTIEISPLTLLKFSDKELEELAIHELLHILLYKYTSIAETLTSKQEQQVLENTEEQTVTHLTKVFVHFPTS